MANENLLVRLDVDEETGRMFFFGTDLEVEARPLGNADIFSVHVWEKHQAEGDVFTRYARSLRESAPGKANAYSSSKDWETIHLQGASDEDGEGNAMLQVPVQYYLISDEGLRKALGLN